VLLTASSTAEEFCLRVGGLRIDEALPMPFSTPSLLPYRSALAAEKNIEAGHEADLAQWRLQVERARYETERAQRVTGL